MWVEVAYVGLSRICGSKWNTWVKLECMWVEVAYVEQSRTCGSMSMVLCGSGCGFTWVGVGGTCTCRRGVVVSKSHMWVH